MKTLFPHIEMMPTGGVLCEAIAVGVGADLVDVKAIREESLDAIGEKTRKYLEIVKNL